MNDLTRPEVDAKLAASEAKLEARLANFDANLKSGFADLRSDMARTQADVHANASQLRAEMARMQTDAHKNTADLIRWGVGIGIAGVAATVGLLTYMTKFPAPGQSQATTPIVVYVQPPAPAAEPKAK
ncbi:MAG: hypothetical protein ABIT83_22970 [Massilia sp.]